MELKSFTLSRSILTNAPPPSVDQPISSPMPSIPAIRNDSGRQIIQSPSKDLPPVYVATDLTILDAGLAELADFGFDVEQIDSAETSKIGHQAHPGGVGVGIRGTGENLAPGEIRRVYRRLSIPYFVWLFEMGKRAEPKISKEDPKLWEEIKEKFLIVKNELVKRFKKKDILLAMNMGLNRGYNGPKIYKPNYLPHSAIKNKSEYLISAEVKKDIAKISRKGRKRRQS